MVQSARSAVRLALLAALLAAQPALAFHSGGVGECEGCHTMHNSLDGAAMTAAYPQYQAGPYLLQGNQSENCLNCHQHAGDTGPSGYHISTAVADLQPVAFMAGGAPVVTNAVPLQMTPGGDFGWLHVDVPLPWRGTPNTNFGHNRGHNIVAPLYDYEADAVKTVAPGGSFIASNLACSSCHDPHARTRILDVTAADQQVVPAIGGATAPIKASGSNGANPGTGFAVGTYRILGGSGYAPKSYNARAFNTIAPVAKAPGSSSSGYNRSEALTETVIEYGKGMSEYCANCHPAMLENSYVSGTAMLVHPAGNTATFGAAIAANYLAYVKSGDLSKTGANYTSLVPFETQQVNLTTMSASSTGAKGTGPVASAASTVSCLSCHRAHASGFASMLRFAHESEFMTVGTTAAPAYDTSTSDWRINRGFSTVAAQEAQYYGRPATEFAAYQRLLCNKCHAKD